MKFCECNGLMLPQKDEDGNAVWVCRNCGKVKKVKDGGKFSKKMRKGRGIPVIDPSAQKDKISTIKQECPKCGAKKAQWWLVQTRSGDEAATRFYKCVECGHQWRERG